MAPNRVKLSTGKGHVQQSQLHELAPTKGKGKKRPDIKTLKLSTKELSTLECPAGSPTFSPKTGREPLFRHLVHLAKATTIHVVFVFSQLHQHYRGSFKAFAKAARGLARYPVDALLIQ